MKPFCHKFSPQHSALNVQGTIQRSVLSQYKTTECLTWVNVMQGNQDGLNFRDFGVTVNII